MESAHHFLPRETATRPRASKDHPSLRPTLVHLIQTMTDATDSDDLDITRNVRRNLGVDVKLLVDREYSRTPHFRHWKDKTSNSQSGRELTSHRNYRL